MIVLANNCALAFSLPKLSQSSTSCVLRVFQNLLSLPSNLVSAWSEGVVITSNLKGKNYRTNKYLASLVIALISSPCRYLIFQNFQPLLITLHFLLSLSKLQSEFLCFSLLRHTQSLDSTSFQKYSPIASSTSPVNGRS
jgi:hypothetical protein